MLELDRDANLPLHRQLYNSLRSHILDGRLPPKTRLPATRVLAGDLGVSRNTVIAAYDALLAEGYLDSIAGSGTRVALLPAPPARRRTACAELPQLSARGRLMTTQPRDRTIPGRIAFHPGYPEIATFPFATWSRLLALAMRNVREDLFGYHLVNGHPRLRRAIAEYLAVSRGVKCTPEQVIVVTGTQAALDLIARLFMDPGDHFWIEDPGYVGAYSAFLAAGGRPAPLPVGPGGWQLDAAGPRPRLIFVTPSCQWPLGLVMPMEVRLRLLHVAEHHDAWIIEDDYDSEYRFRGHPIPAMQGLDDSGRVIYIGTLSKTMFPSLRVAYIVVPPTLIDGFDTAVSITGQYPPLVLQAALADFIAQGFLATHLRRMRRLYARRQREFVALCRARLDRWLTVNEADTGMQVIGHFRHEALDDRDVLAVALRHGVDFSPLSRHYRHATPVQGMFLGYAGVSAEAMRQGVERLRKAFEEIDLARAGSVRGGAPLATASSHSER
jgi:GntR family transcriptional regulator/MocR family aminotransferase